MKNLSKTNLILIILTIIGGLLHFYNLNWGAPFYFHPDERNIASAVTQLHFPHQMNPNFFAYGSLPIYTIYFTGLLINTLFTFPPQTDQFAIAIQISRFYSALFATLLIPILFVIARSIATKQSHTSQNANTTGLLTALLATTSVGFIQFAHFGTFEMWLTFFSVLLFWTCLQKPTKKILLLIGIIFGILVAIKVSSLVLLPLLVLSPIMSFRATDKESRNLIRSLHALRLVGMTLFILIIAFLVYYLTNPFVFLDTESFKGSMHYETSLALGTLPVFYTGEFFHTIPIIFQLIKIYPFLLNPLVTLLFIPASFYILFKAIKARNLSYYLLFAICYLLFFSQAFLFVKWTRYMVPTLPFIFLIIAIALSDFLNKKRQPFSHLTIVAIFVCINVLFAFSYFVTVFVRLDTRIQAYHFAQTTIPPNAFILSEVYDLGIVPFNQMYANITLFNFYDLDNNSVDATPAILSDELSSRQYIILPSQRILKTRLLQKDKFPLANEFYTKLITGQLGYQKIYETPCDLFCKITYLGSPVWSFEETANVFDRPTIFIFEKNKK